MIDERLRALERAVRTGDEQAARRLEAERERLKEPLDRVRERTEATLRGWDADRGIPRLDTILGVARARALELLGCSRLPRGWPAELAELARDVYARSVKAHARAESERMAMLARRVEGDLGGIITLALIEVQGRCRQRCLRVQEVLALVERVRDHDDVVPWQDVSIDAEHEVGKSYKYPVTYTSAAARRIPDGPGAGVLLRIMRTATFGARARTPRRVALLIPLEVPGS
jgi:hypothetical protein